MIHNPINSLICASIFYNVDTYDFFIPLNLESGIKNVINKELIFIFIHKIIFKYWNWSCKSIVNR